jgi:hypothetical protein
MTLPEPRKGKSLEELNFRLYSELADETTLGDPEKSLLSSLRHLCSLAIANEVLRKAHRITNKKDMALIAKNIKIYLQQAFEFYEAAQFCKSDTAPLFYYYSFLNFGKALCEIKYPRFHQARESRRHGIQWHPFTKMNDVHVSLTVRGVWHTLWEAVVGQRCKVRNPTKVRVKDLFALCPEVCVEYEKIFKDEWRTIEIEEPEILTSLDEREIWIRFSVSRRELETLHISIPRFINFINKNESVYHQVQSNSPGHLLFESSNPKQIEGNLESSPIDIILPEIRKLNLFTSLDIGRFVYAIPIQDRIPLLLPQLIVLYTLIFWLGSLVRYDPHSVIKLKESKYWNLIDGIMSESRIWLLELFEWEFYQKQTILRSVR